MRDEREPSEDVGNGRNASAQLSSSATSALATAEVKQFAKASIAVKGDLDSVLQVRPYRPHALKPIPTRVLEEDDYVSLLQMLIERDFFPDLLRLRLQKEILDKERIGDFIAAKEASQRLAATRFEQSSQRSGDVASTRKPRQRVKLLDGREFELDISQLSLREFQSLFTSEDNSSFEQIIQEEKIKLSQEQAWIERSSLLHNAHNAETKAAIESGERPARLVYANADSRNPLMFPLTDGNVGVMELKTIPDSNETVALCIGTYTKDSEIPMISRGVIVHSNTRFEAGDDDDDSLGSSILESMAKEQQRKIELSEKRVKDGSMFDAMVSQGQYSASAVERQRQIEQINRRGRRPRMPGLETPITTPAHHGYQFVHTPSMDPGVETSPLMTWGKVAATPLLLSGGRPETEDDRGPRFQIPELSVKEMTAQRLAENVTKKLRAHKARQSTALRDVLKAVTPLVRGASRTGSSELFKTPRLTGMQLLRRHSALKRTPLMPGVTPTSGMTPLIKATSRAAESSHEIVGERKEQLDRKARRRLVSSEPELSATQSDFTKRQKHSESKNITDNLLEF